MARSENDSLRSNSYTTRFRNKPVVTIGLLAGGLAIPFYKI